MDLGIRFSALICDQAEELLFSDSDGVPVLLSDEKLSLREFLCNEVNTFACCRRWLEAQIVVGEWEVGDGTIPVPSFLQSTLQIMHIGHPWGRMGKNGRMCKKTL